jgi:hypothetical protein
VWRATSHFVWNRVAGTPDTSTSSVANWRRTICSVDAWSLLRISGGFRGIRKQELTARVDSPGRPRGGFLAAKQRQRSTIDVKRELSQDSRCCDRTRMFTPAPRTPEDFAEELATATCDDPVLRPGIPSDRHRPPFPEHTRIPATLLPHPHP